MIPLLCLLIFMSSALYAHPGVRPNHKTLDADQLYTIGKNFRVAGNYKRAIPYLSAAHDKNPSHLQASLELALSTLAIQKFDTGFALLDNHVKRHWPTEPTWNGIDDLNGKVVMIHAPHWGLGDTIMLTRFIKPIKDWGAQIILSAQEALEEVVSWIPFVDYFFPDQPDEDENKPCGYYRRHRVFTSVDFHINLLSLPTLLATTEKTIPSAPYLEAHPERVAYWQEKLASDNKLRVGICWRGEQRKEPDLQERSMPLANLEPLFNHPDITLYSLQKGPGCKELDQFDWVENLVVFDDSFDVDHGPFIDTIAVMEHLDVILTIDTSTAHCAGARGKKTLVMLPHAADWRYGVGTSRSIWYPSMKLFRQPTPGNWKPLVNRVAQELFHMAREKKRL